VEYSYPEISRPPSDPGVIVSVREPLPALTLKLAGAPGDVYGDPTASSGDHTDVPAAVVAATWTLYTEPFVSPDTVIGDEVPDTSITVAARVLMNVALTV
jgi:hypothetical protein